MEVRRLDPARGFSDYLKRVEQRIDDNATRPTGDVVLRGTLTATDPTSGVSTIIGQLPDGTTGLQQWVNDTTPPDQPSIPTVNAINNLLTVSWDGLDVNGANPPVDYDRTIVQMSPDGSTGWVEVDTLFGNSVAYISGQPVGVIQYFRLISIDKNGNQSLPSAVRSATPTALVDSPDIQTEINRIDTRIDSVSAASADGKNTIWYSSTEPTGTHTVGDTWFETDNDNKIYRWDGSAWVPTLIGSNAVSYIDAGIISVGYLMAQRIQSKSITVDKLAITSTDNLVSQANFSGPTSYWEQPTGVTINATAGQGNLPAMRITGISTPVTSLNLSNKVSVMGGTWLYGSFDVKTTGTLAAGALKLFARAYSTATAYTDVVLASSSTVSANTWTRVFNKAALPANAVAMEFYLSVANNAIGTITDIDYVEVTRAYSGELIVDGSISAVSLSATAIDGKVITGSTLRTAASGYRVEISSDPVSGSYVKALSPSLTGARIEIVSHSTSGTYLTATDKNNRTYLTANQDGLSLIGSLKQTGGVDAYGAPISVAISNMGTSLSRQVVGLNFIQDSSPISQPPGVYSPNGTALTINSSFANSYLTLGDESGSAATLRSIQGIKLQSEGYGVEVRNAYNTWGDLRTGSINGVPVVSHAEAAIQQTGVPNGTVWGPGMPTFAFVGGDTFCHWSANDTLIFDKVGLYSISWGGVYVGAGATGRSYYSLENSGFYIARNNVAVGEDNGGVSIPNFWVDTAGAYVNFKYYQTTGGSRSVNTRIRITRWAAPAV